MRICQLLVQKVPGRRRSWWTWQQVLLGVSRLSSSASACKRFASRRQPTVAKLSEPTVAKLLHETVRCLPALERVFHLDFNGIDHLCSALLVAGCKTARQNALQHDVGCDEAVCVIHKLLCQP